MDAKQGPRVAVKTTGAEGATEARVAALGSAIHLTGEHAKRAPSFWARYRRDRAGVVALIVIALMVILVVVCPPFTGYTTNGTDLTSRLEPPSRMHLLGTDEVGRDVWTRFLIGGRISLTVGLVGAAMFITIGTVLGAIAGYLGGPVDALLMRLTDVFMCFPTYVIMLIMVSVFSPSLWITLAVIGSFNWPGTARLVRGQFLSLRQRDFIVAAQSVGVPGQRIILRHLLPNVVNQLVVMGSFGIVLAIMTETGLSFLGLGVQFPTPSWGNLVSTGMRKVALVSWPWLWMPAALAIVAVTLSITYIGEGLRKVLDPQSAGAR